MWGNQGFDQGGGDQGGGYLNSPGNFGSPQGSQPERKARQRAQNILPCTLAQILAAEQQDDKFVADNIELHQVTVVGLVRAVKESSTRLDYEIDDMTGPPMEIRQFVDNDENTPDEERTVAMRENTYVRVYGHVRSFQGKKSVVAFKIVPILDMNELTSHLLEVIHSHLCLTKGQNSMDTGGQPQNTGYIPPNSAGGVETPGGVSGAQSDQGLNTIQRQVLAVIRSSSDESEGVGINEICENLRGVPQAAIRTSIDFLSGEGHIYSTIDDDHFRSTDSM